MTHRTTPPGGSDSDYLRQQAYQQDAEALREDLVTYFQSSAAAEELQEKLGVMIEQALRKVVYDALQDREVQATIRDQVAAAVVAGVRKEIVSAEKAILGEVRGNLLPQWRKEVLATLGQGFHQPREPGPRPGQVPPDGDAGTEESLPEEGDFPPMGDTPGHVDPREPWYQNPWVKFAGAGVCLVLLLLAAYFLGRRQPAPVTFGRDSHVTAPTVPSDVAEPVANPQEDLFVGRMGIPEAALASDSPLQAELQAHPFAEQYRCWFDEQARRHLDSLVRDRSLGREIFRQSLSGAFGSCVSESYKLGTSKLPVFAAQGLVHYLLTREEQRSWGLCFDGRRPAGLPDLTTFKSDGNPGPGTYSLLNGFLSCTGHSSRLEIGENSSTEDYLFTAYAALKELESRR